MKKEGINAHHVSIATDNGKSKGYGFIQFNDQDNYYKCLKKMDGYIIKGKAIKVRERQKKNNKDKNCINSHELDNNMLNRYNNYYVNNIDDVNNVNMISNNNINNKNSKYDNNNQDSINRENNEDLTEISSLDSNSTKGDNDKKRIVNNLDLLLNNNSNVLNKKIQESIDNMYKKFNNSSKNNEISNILLYYNSK